MLSNGHKDDNNNVNKIESIDESIDLSEEVFQQLMANNELKHNADIMEKGDLKSLHYCFVKTGYLILLAIATIKNSDVVKARNSVDELIKLSNKYRRTGFLINIMKIIKTPNYQKYTDVECHAEMLYFYGLLFKAVTISLASNSVYDFIKVVYNVQKFTRSMFGCNLMLKSKLKWESDKSRQRFEAGVRLAMGCAHIVISNTPPKLLRVMNFLGYSGVESIGFYQINKVAFEKSGIFSQLSRIALLGYWTVVHSYLYLGAKDLDKWSKVLNKELERYPKCLLLLLIQCNINLVGGQISETIDMYKHIENKLAPLGRAENIFRVLLMFANALNSDWSGAVKYSEHVKNEEVISPAFFTYTEAVFRHARSVDENNLIEKQLAGDLFSKVPDLRVRHLGKTITPEKIAMAKAEKFSRQDEFLILPEMEFLYQYNGLTFIQGNPVLLKRFLDRIEIQVNKYHDDIKTSDNLDNYLSSLFYKAVIIKLLGDFSKAKVLLKIILENESRIGSDFSIPPQTCLELGLIELELNNKEESAKWLHKSIDDYSKYVNENFVHLRAYAGLRELGITTDKHIADQTKLEEYRKQWLKDIEVEETKYQSIVKTEETV